MPSFKEVAREYFPDESDKDLDFIIWNETGYPEFWNIGVDGYTVEECFRKQLKDAQEKLREVV